MDQSFEDEVVRALESRGLTEVRFIGRARLRRCNECDTRLYKFRAIGEGEGWVAYACYKCHSVFRMSLMNLKPITVQL